MTHSDIEKLITPDIKPVCLLVDDSPLDRESASHIIRHSFGNKIRLIEANSVTEALKLLTEYSVQIVLLDKCLSLDSNSADHDSIASIPKMLQIQRHLQVFMLTGDNDYAQVVKAMRLGATNYFVKGSSPDLLVAQIRLALETAQIHQDALELRSKQHSDHPPKLVGNSSAMRQLRIQVEALRETGRPVLLLGENGTGKSTIARMLHLLRSQFLGEPKRPFHSLNLAALSENTLEAELFGSVRGAYTDAVDRPGFIELANRGTLFLDEIGDISPQVQKKLLTVLETGRFHRLGSQKELSSQFHLICATNRDLESLMKSSQFREDLFMRISTFTLRVPSLKDRREDIPELLREILPRIGGDNHLNVVFEDLPVDFVEALCTWPIRGNIRGIEQALHRLMLFAARDVNGKPIFTGWRSIPGLIPTQAQSESGAQGGSSAGGGPDVPLLDRTFPGLEVHISAIRDKIIAQAVEAFATNREIATSLGVSTASVSQHMKRLGLKLRRRGSER